MVGQNDSETSPCVTVVRIEGALGEPITMPTD